MVKAKATTILNLTESLGTQAARLVGCQAILELYADAHAEVDPQNDALFVVAEQLGEHADKIGEIAQAIAQKAARRRGGSHAH